ncbi:MAG: GNAT family N-acetyltransferase [Caulobacteraceae bacterium]
MERLADTFILPAGLGDAATLARVHVKAWRETYAGLLPAGYLAAMSVPLHARRWRHQLTRARPGELVLAAEGPEGPVGYCAGALDPAAPGRAEIFTLYLLREAQGLGLGRRLMESAARVFQGQGASALALWVLAGNLRARRFYRRLGGALGPERPVRGWGGDLREVCYAWGRIETLANG